MNDEGAHPGRRDLVIMSLGNALSFVVITMTRPLVPLFAVATGASSALVGIIVATYALVPLFLAIPGGTWVDRWGCRRIFMLGSLAVIAGLGIVPLAPSTPFLLLSQALTGSGQLLVILSGQTFSTSISDGPDREANLGLYTTFISGGQLIGPLLGGAIADALGYPGAFGAAALAGGLAVIVGIFVSDLPTPRETRRARSAARDGGAPARAGGSAASPSTSPSPKPNGPGTPKGGLSFPHIRNVLRIAGVQMAMVSSFGIIFAMGVRQAFFPIHVEGLGFSATAVGLFLSVRALSSMIVRPFMPHIITLAGGRLWALSISMGIGALAIGITPLTTTYATLMIVSVMIGIGVGLVQPLSMLAVAESTDLSERGLAMGVRLTGNRFAQFANPLFFGFIAQLFSLDAAFYAGGALLLGVTLLLWRWRDVFDEMERPSSGSPSPA